MLHSWRASSHLLLQSTAFPSVTAELLLWSIKSFGPSRTLHLPSAVQHHHLVTNLYKRESAILVWFSPSTTSQPTNGPPSSMAWDVMTRVRHMSHLTTASVASLGTPKMLRFKYVLTGGEIADHYTHRYDRRLRGTINSWNLFQDQRENKSQSKCRNSRPYGPQPLKWSCCHRVPHQSLVRCQQMSTEYTGRNLRGHQHTGELSVFTEQKEDVTPDQALAKVHNI